MSSSRSREETPLRERIGALVDDRLLEVLSEAFPVKNPEPGTPIDRVWFDAGSAYVVQFLRECQKQVTEL